MRLVNYIKETKGELKHVSWPKRRQVVYFTIIVVVLSIGTAFFLGFFDTIFGKLLESVV